MAYQGGKARIGKEIADQLLRYEAHWGKHNLPYLEPFFGFGGVARWIVPTGRPVYGSDLNKDIILMWKALQRGWIPPRHVTREQHARLRHAPHSALRGYVGMVWSYRGGWFNGYNRGFRAEAQRQKLLNLASEFRKVHFSFGSYERLKPKGMLIYCDPPYAGTTGFRGAGASFDSQKFWETMRRWSRNNLVIVSEYKAPADFKSIWNKSTLVTFGRLGGIAPQKRREHLFVYRG